MKKKKKRKILISPCPPIFSCIIYHGESVTKETQSVNCKQPVSKRRVKSREEERKRERERERERKNERESEGARRGKKRETSSTATAERLLLAHYSFFFFKAKKQVRSLVFFFFLFFKRVLPLFLPVPLDRYSEALVRRRREEKERETSAREGESLHVRKIERKHAAPRRFGSACLVSRRRRLRCYCCMRLSFSLLSLAGLSRTFAKLWTYFLDEK